MFAIVRLAEMSAYQRGGVNLDLDALAEAANTIASSVVSWGMAVRLGESPAHASGWGCLTIW
jgi:hypothetical protein